MAGIEYEAKALDVDPAKIARLIVEAGGSTAVRAPAHAPVCVRHHPGRSGPVGAAA